MFVYDLHDHTLWNTAMARTRISQSFQISQWSTFDRRVETLQHWAQWNINSLMVKYVQIWNSIL